MKKSRNHPSKASVSIYELQAKLRLSLQNFKLTSKPRRFPSRRGAPISMRTKVQSDYAKDKAREGMSFDTSPEPDAPWKRELKKLSDEMRPEYNPEELTVVKKGEGRS